MPAPELLFADWPAPDNVVAVASCRSGGVSEGRYASLNLGQHVGDDSEHVRINRDRFADALSLRAQPLWLNQVHGSDVVVTGESFEQPPPADAAVVRDRSSAAVVLTADCLPVLIAAEDGSVVAAAHAGWRGLAAGVLENTVAACDVAPASLLAWIGPAICAAHYEVGDEVRAAFVTQDPATADCFTRNARERWQADLPAIAVHRLARCGVTAVFRSGCCTYSDAERFYSYRRDGETGRLATLIARR